MAFASGLGQAAVLVFFPAEPGDGLLAQLAKFQATLPGFLARGVQVLAVSDAAVGELAALASASGMTFPLASDAKPARAVAGQYGVVSSGGRVQPAIFVVDGDRLIRRVYEPDGADLPNPAMVLRAITKLAEAPRPVPVVADDWQLGPQAAPVTIVEYADYQCGYCQDAFRALQEILPGFTV